MWGKRKARNRRLEREEVLEVRMRSRDVRQARIRGLAAAIGALGFAAVGALAVWQAYQWALQHFLYRNDAYAVRRIELVHEGRLRPDQIRRWAGVEIGQNLLALAADLDRLRNDLELNPWIQRADVEAIRPDCLRLVVREREPVAQVVVWRFRPSDSRTWPETNYVDAAGWVMPPLRPEWMKPGIDGDFSHLPRLIGVDPAEVVPGQPIRLPLVESALGLIQAYEDSTLYSLVDLDQVDLTGPAVLRATLRQGTELRFGLADHERQMRRWRSILDYAESQGRVLAWLDLSVTNNLPARWLESTNPPPASRPAKPKKTPRRHV